MMEDQQKSITEALVSKGYMATPVAEGIQIETVIGKTTLHFICVLGRFFPYEIPSVMLKENEWALIPAMPHKYVDGFICTFDRGVVFPNYMNPVQLVVETIEKAREIIKKGMQGENKSDYMDEFLAYWESKKGEKAQLFIDELSSCKKLVWIKDESRSIISDSLEKAHRIFKNALGHKPEEYMSGILIPVKEPCLEAIPKSNIQLVNLIRKEASSWQLFNSFVQENIEKKHFFVVVALLYDETPMLFGWQFVGSGIPDGFRKNHVDLNVYFSQSHNSGSPVAIDNCCRERLLFRGGDGHQVHVDNVVIIGCGSVGSMIAEAFLNYGSSHFVLVDNEVLSYENIARHYAGYFFVGKSKVDAIKLKLELHNPSIVCDTFCGNAFEFVKDYTRWEKEDLLVIAVASTPFEQYVINQIVDGVIRCPVLIVWVEPYAIAGHGILITHPTNVYDELFDKRTLEYRYGVLEKPERYLKREAGCQASFMPYSSFSMQEMIYRILEISLQYHGTGKNYRFTWCGRLTEAKEKGFPISLMYEDVADYSLLVERVD